MKAVTETAVKVTAETADVVSDVMDGVVVGAAVAAPLTEGATLPIAAGAATVGAAADFVSLGAKTVGALLPGGDVKAATDQAFVVGVGLTLGFVANKAVTSLVKTNVSDRFYNPSNGQFVSNSFRTRVVAVSDATQVVLPKLVGF